MTPILSPNRNAGPVGCSIRFGSLPPEAGDQPTGSPGVALVLLAEPRSQELLLRGCLNEYPQERYRPDQQQADVQRGNAAPEQEGEIPRVHGVANEPIRAALDEGV